jgi:hypothetical protein
VAVLFTLTLFVSAFLLFLVQPMLARMVLPLLGGTPAVWNTCMVFFQALLLAGYAYAHAAPAWLGTRRQAVLHIGLLFLPLLVLPIAVPPGWTPPETGNPVPGLLALLLATIGLPFFVVSTSGPLLQRWFALTGHRRARDPYFLYAASNLGSMIALLGYPFLFEPQFGLARQSRLWTMGYGVLVALTCVCAVMVLRAAPVEVPADEPAEAPLRLAWTRRLYWVLLAFVPSSLMLSVTTYLTTDIASIPLLWVLPLSLYLLTFIFVFGRRQLIPLSLALRFLPLVVLTIVFVQLSEATEPVALLIGVHLFGLFCVGMVCHGLLAADRPPVGHLTEFYLWLSVGGVLGGLFNALVAPLVFSSIAEYPLVLVLACLVRPATTGRPIRLNRAAEVTSPQSASPLATNATTNELEVAVQLPSPVGVELQPVPAMGLVSPVAAVETEETRPAAEQQAPVVEVAHIPTTANNEVPSRATETASPLTRGELWRRLLDVVLPLLLGGATAGVIVVCQKAGVAPGPKSVALMFAAPMVVCYTFMDRSLRFALGVAAVLLASSLYQGVLGKVEYRTRSFFGVHRVTRDPTGSFHVLAHGNTIHGQQSIVDDPIWKEHGKPLTYYYPTGPIGHLFGALDNDPRLRRVGIIGLGAGTMVAYARPGWHWTYFEIDPAVARIAQDPNLFSYYTKARARGVQLDVVFGDARLTLERTEEKFGMIVLDAFSSDAIPVHLLTREALQVYLSRLEEGGFLLFNISNRYLDLEPVVAALAADAGLECLFEDDRYSDGSDEKHGKTKSQWLVMARRIEDLPRVRGKNGIWAPPTPRTGLPVWTDDYSNLFQVFRSLPGRE